MHMFGSSEVSQSPCYQPSCWRTCWGGMENFGWRLEGCVTVWQVRLFLVPEGVLEKALRWQTSMFFSLMFFPLYRVCPGRLEFVFFEAYAWEQWWHLQQGKRTLPCWSSGLSWTAWVTMQDVTAFIWGPVFWDLLDHNGTLKASHPPNHQPFSPDRDKTTSSLGSCGQMRGSHSAMYRTVGVWVSSLECRVGFWDWFCSPFSRCLWCPHPGWPTRQQPIAIATPGVCARFSSKESDREPRIFIEIRRLPFDII